MARLAGFSVSIKALPSRMALSLRANCFIVLAVLLKRYGKRSLAVDALAGLDGFGWLKRRIGEAAAVWDCGPAMPATLALGRTWTEGVAAVFPHSPLRRQT